MIRTYIDAGVLIAAARELGSASNRALALLDDPRREFASSIFVQLEVLPKAIFNKRSSEADFYRRYFDAVSHWATPAKPALSVWKSPRKRD